ncbi:hypothetical protein BP6252_10493 [Coleophoma cylindrospora]|uniref:Uncharacterized protein n=1 Tax=Coleophoma cylindrospora TaxID=1849047 RepID=A0A3D8QST5_9HELO|nr:hypothetical protein BP6252_10493 [Coleophoma cylindrospora]
MAHPEQSRRAADDEGTALDNASLLSPSFTEYDTDYGSSTAVRTPSPPIFAELQDLLDMNISSMLSEMNLFRVGDIVPVRFYEPPRGATQIKYILILEITRQGNDTYCKIAPIYEIDPVVYMHERFARRRVDFIRLVHFIPEADDEYSVGYQGSKLPLGSCIKLSTVMAVLQDLSDSFEHTRGRTQASSTRLDEDDLETVYARLEKKMENGGTDSSLDDGAFTADIKMVMSALYVGVAFNEVDKEETRKAKRARLHA